MRHLVALLAVCPLTLPSLGFAAPAAKPLAVCIAQGTGAVMARPKCKTGEVPLNGKTLAGTFAVTGPQGETGPQGLAGPRGEAGPKGDQGVAGLVNTASCYTKKDEQQLSESGQAFSVAFCNDAKSEFMLSDGIEFQPFVDLAITERELAIADGDTVPTGILISTVGRATSVYQLRAVIV